MGPSTLQPRLAVWAHGDAGGTIRCMSHLARPYSYTLLAIPLHPFQSVPLTIVIGKAAFDELHARPRQHDQIQHSPACSRRTAVCVQTVFLDVEIDATPVGRIVIELSSLTPKTSENFRGLCTADNDLNLTYLVCLGCLCSFALRAAAKMQLVEQSIACNLASGTQNVLRLMMARCAVLLRYSVLLVQPCRRAPFIASFQGS